MMKVFIFEYVDNLTNNYHSEGGLVVIADTLKNAINMAVEKGVSLSPSEESAVIVHDLAGDPEPQVYIFPDAGCC